MVQGRTNGLTVTKCLVKIGRFLSLLPPYWKYYNETQAECKTTRSLSFAQLQLRLLPNLLIFKHNSTGSTWYMFVTQRPPSCTVVHYICCSFHYAFAWTMTDTQESVVINQSTIGQRFGFLRRLLNNAITSEWLIPSTIVAVLAVGCVGALCLHQTTSAIRNPIKSLETTMEENAW